MFGWFKKDEEKETMIDLNETLCYCNDLTAGEIVKCIKENNFTSIDELIEQEICPVGDKCEACHEEGYQNDGFSLAMLLSLIKQKRL